MELSDIVLQGYIDGTGGKTKNDCPYDFHIGKRLWLQGLEMAEKELSQQMELLDEK